MNTTTKNWAIALLLLACLTNCSDDDVVAVPDGAGVSESSLTRAEQQMAEAYNSFALTLFQTLRTESDLVVAPLSTAFSLGMISGGAEGATQSQICGVLGTAGGNTGAVNTFFRKILDGATATDSGSKLQVANNIYVNKAYGLNSRFVEMARDYYDAAPEALDFSDGHSLTVINDWVYERTDGLVPEFLSAEELSPALPCCLLNALCFSGTWAEVFNSRLTSESAFAGGKEVLMMRQTNLYDYGEDDVAQYLRLPYADSTFCMTVYLPRAEVGVDRVVERITERGWQPAAFLQRTVSVALPRFDVTSDIQLSSALSAMGMPLAFSPQADFSALCSTPMYISAMKQKARVIVSEDGTVAAAATGTTAATSDNSSGIIKFRADHPFCYTISEERTGIILFVGQFYGK